MQAIMKFICYTDLHQLPANASVLFKQSEQGSVFFSRPWLDNLANTAVDDALTPVLACVVAGDRVLAILPLMKSEGYSWYSLKHRYTTHYSLLVVQENQQQVLTCMAEGLAQLPLEALLLEPVGDDDSRLNSLQKIMQTLGFSCERIFRFYNWVYPVQGQSFSDYLADRPTRLRNTISRKQRKLEREHGYQIQLFTGKDVPRKMPDYYTVYNASWKANEQYVSFLDGIVAAFSEQGWTRLAVLYVKNRPVAAQLWFVAHAKASIFRLVYDKSWKAYSPGSILTAFLMEHVIDQCKVEEIDFLTGNDAYKQDWMSERRERFALSCVRSKQPSGRYQSLLALLNRLVKKQQ
jgi:hypothetical protein